MILAGLTVTSTLLWILIVSLGVLVLVILYRGILRRMGKGSLVKEHYAVLYGLENTHVTGEIEFYFTIEQPKYMIFCLLDSAMNELQIIAEKQYDSGGHIIRFNTESLSNGVYFYCLRSDNQKTMKRMMVQHDNMTA